MPVESLPSFQELFDATYAPVSTRDRPCPARPQCRFSRQTRGGCACSRPGGRPGLPVKYRVCQALRVEDSATWADYCRCSRSIRKARRLDAEAAWMCEPPATKETVESSEADLF